MERAIYLVGLNHRSADLAARERFLLPEGAALPPGNRSADNAVSESLTLSTCNRVEVLVVGRGEQIPKQVIHAWAARCGSRVHELTRRLYVYRDAVAVRHLFSVAAGLDSLVLGEPQILGQLKAAYRQAVESGAAGVVLNRLLHKAFTAAKRVRTETGVAQSAVSVSYAAVELARKIFGSLQGRSVLLVGAGDMAELAATHLAGQGARMSVCNRTFERAADLAQRFLGEALPYDGLGRHLEHMDIVIFSTASPQPVLTACEMRDVMRRRKNKPIFLIDIAVPRDVEAAVNALDNVYLYTIDELGGVVEQNQAARREEAVRALRIIEEEAAHFQNWLHGLSLQPTIVELVRRSERIAKTELERTLRHIGPVSPEMERALDQMLGAVLKKINHDPITFLQRRFAETGAAERYLDLTRQLFNLDGGDAADDGDARRRRHKR